MGRSAVEDMTMAEGPDMDARPVRIPGPDHPISIAEDGELVEVKVAGRVIAQTSRALTLREASYRPVHYIPRDDVDMAALTPTDKETYCPYKGRCTYFTIPDGGTKAVNAAWSYEHPHPAVAAIQGHIAFYPDRVDTIEVSGP
jgi:uncharacterized protein (DUF427 family)